MRGPKITNPRPLLHSLRAACSNGATSVMYEGAPDYTGQGRASGGSGCERKGVTIFSTAPTAIRSLHGGRPCRRPRPHLAAAAQLGEPRSTPRPGSGTGPSAANTVRSSDTWWRRRPAGSVLLSPLPGIASTKPVRRRGRCREWSFDESGAPVSGPTACSSHRPRPRMPNLYRERAIRRYVFLNLDRGPIAAGDATTFFFFFFFLSRSSFSYICYPRAGSGRGSRSGTRGAA